MAFKELIKDFSKIRSYLKEFFVYGYNARGRVGEKSDRSYDDEKRRIQSYLGDYIHESYGEDGKSVALSIDVRNVDHNPLFRALKSASFTDKDITLHFILMDILCELGARSGDCQNGGQGLQLSEIISRIEDEYLSHFEKALSFDESTLRKKLAEYEAQGLVKITKEGSHTYYLPIDICATHPVIPCYDTESLLDALDFASEILPLGILGSTLLDKFPKRKNTFSFKHHYIAQTIDSEIILELFTAIREKRWVRLYSKPGRKSFSYAQEKNVDVKDWSLATAKALPLKIFSSSTTGRQYVAVHILKRRKLGFYRLDNLEKVELLEECSEFDSVMERFNNQKKFLWGVSFGKAYTHPETVEFTVRFREDEKHIYQRLIREKRNGTVELVENAGEGEDGENHFLYAKYSALVYDAHELLPWIRTFICRICELHISNKELEDHFWEDVKLMRGLYEQEYF